MPETPVFKPYFLGPKSENERWVRTQLQMVLDDWFAWRQGLFADDPAAISLSDQSDPSFLRERDVLNDRLCELVGALRGEVPTYSPRYIGHMVSEVALPGLIGHFAALLHNPNNTSREASKVGTALETEAIAMLAEMVGFDPLTARGHFTSGGTVANLEAVWRARYRLDHRLALALTLAERHGEPLDIFADAHLTAAAFRRRIAEFGVEDAAMRERSAVLGNPFDISERISRHAGRPYRGPVLLAPGHKHYSWMKAANVFGLGEDSFWTVAVDREGRLSPESLAERIDQARREARPVLMVVSVAGTTEMGELDPIDRVHDQLDALLVEQGLDIWRHVDAAYGGYFCAIGGDDPALAAPLGRALHAVRRAHSVTIDPHKLGYAPYACGAFLARDAEHDTVSSFAAPYVERRELGDAAWTSSLEGSRPATGAAATWLTGKTLGFGSKGLGAVLRSTIESCAAVRAALTDLPLVRPLDPTDTNIFCFSIAEKGDRLSLANERTKAAHAQLVASPGFALSRTILTRAACPDLIDAHVASYDGVRDDDCLVLLRCVVMNPFWQDDALRTHLLPQLVDAVAQAALAYPPISKAPQPA